MITYRWEVRYPTSKEVVASGDSLRPKLSNPDDGRKLLDHIEKATKKVPAGQQCIVTVWADDDPNPCHVHVYDAP